MIVHESKEEWIRCEDMYAMDDELGHSIKGFGSTNERE